MSAGGAEDTGGDGEIIAKSDSISTSNIVPGNLDHLDHIIINTDTITVSDTSFMPESNTTVSTENMGQPYFDNATKRDYTAAVGQPAYMHCRVKNLADRAVSSFSLLIKIQKMINHG